MNRYQELMDRIGRGEPILLDGATGTECEHRGVPQLPNAWNGGAALSHPDILRQIHADYIALGADVIISNTFATHRSALRDAGVAADFEAYNRRGVELAVEAREASGADHVVVAGGMSHWSWLPDKPSIDELRTNARDQAQIMADAGADVIFLEMMIEISRMNALLDGIEPSGLGVWVGLTCGGESGAGGRDGGVIRLRDGEPLQDAIEALAGREVDGINLMHTDASLILEGLEVLAKHWDGPVGVYAHSGDYVDGEWILGTEFTPHEYLEYVGSWRNHGLKIVGGCCGIGPAHIAALA